MSYQFSDWKWSRWETPVSDAQSISLHLSLTEGVLQVILDTSSHLYDGLRLRIAFQKILAFRCLQESYMNSLWGVFSKAGSPGKTFIVNNSPWLAELAREDSLFAETSHNVRHYVITSDAEVLEVLSKSPPYIG
jgi:hypothetical protein